MLARFVSEGYENFADIASEKRDGCRSQFGNGVIKVGYNHCMNAVRRSESYISPARSSEFDIEFSQFHYRTVTTQLYCLGLVPLAFVDLSLFRDKPLKST